jgi:hypothetical protein
MTDRCSAEVSFPESYDGKPNSKGAMILKRAADGSTPWTHPFKVGTGENNHIRWWCHSTIGNEFDLGTSRVTGVDANAIVMCVEGVGEASVGDAAAAGSAISGCTKILKISSSAFQGWTPERSRCADHSAKIRARLGPDRLLQIECLGD